MTNTNLNQKISEDDMDLKEFVKVIVNSKKLIISITLIFILIGSSYSFLQKPVFLSSSKLILGTQITKSGIQEISSVIDEVTFYFENVKVTPKGKHYLLLEVFSPSIESSRSDLQLAIDFLIKPSANFFRKKINSVDLNIDLLTNELAVLDEQKMLYNDSVIIARMSELRIELNTLKMKKNNSKHTLIQNEIITEQLPSKILLTALLSTITGFIFSVFITFIRYTLLKNQ